MNESLVSIVSRFGVSVSPADIAPLGKGLINDTFRVTVAAGPCDYVLQRINHHIFTDVDCLQRNIETVTAHIRRKLEEVGTPDIDRRCLRFIPAVGSGKTYYFDGESYWRMMVYIPGSFTYETVNPEYSYCAGLAFGNFQRMLSDLPVQLEESIPDFHNMEFRLQQFRDALVADPVGRRAGVADLVDALLSRADYACTAERLHREGKLPKRICHCDTKVNNMLFDADGNILCVIDLDTVMPGFVFSDIGDFLRTASNTGLEDDRNLDNVSFDMEIFRSFIKGYLESASSFLTQVEIENIPYAAFRFSYMQAVRFLTDYINGDIYYKINAPDHNLVRARAQFRLMECQERAIPEMARIVTGFTHKPGEHLQ